jgi:hypothetical protein
MDATILWITVYLLNGDLSNWHFDEHTAAACEQLRKNAERDMVTQHVRGRANCLPDVGIVEQP